MRKFGMFALALMAGIFASSLAMAADVTLCAGTAGRNYDSVMKSIGIELQNRGNNVTILNLNGSEDILRNLDSGKCDYGPAQKDVHYRMSKDNAGFSATVTPVSLLYNEAITMFCSKDSNLDELSDFDENTTVIVDSLGSGSARTGDNLVTIEKEYGNQSSWINAKVIYSPLDESVAKISLGEADCAFGVGAVPSNWASALDDNGETVSWVYDKDINDLVVGKSPLYNPVRIPYGSYSSKFDTYEIPSILFRSNKKPIDKEVDSLIKRLAPSIGAKYKTF